MFQPDAMVMVDWALQTNYLFHLDNGQTVEKTNSLFHTKCCCGIVEGVLSYSALFHSLSNELFLLGSVCY